MYIYKVNGVSIEPRELIEVVATIDQAEEIANLQDYIRVNALKDKVGEPVFAADSKEFVESIIKSKRGEIYLYYNDDDFVGFFELTCPDNPEELKEDYHVDQYISDVDYENMGVAESFVVMPAYRGNGLQAAMFERMQEIALERGITTLIGTVHPENVYSCNNFDVSGYDTIAEIQSHGGPRYLKYKVIAPVKKR